MTDVTNQSAEYISAIDLRRMEVLHEAELEFPDSLRLQIQSLAHRVAVLEYRVRDAAEFSNKGA